MNVKVVSLGEPIVVSGGKKKQDVAIADVTDTACVGGESEHIHRIQVVCFEERYGVSFGDVTYLSLARDGSKIEDVGAVKEYSKADAGQNCELKDVTILGVLQLDIKKACLNKSSSIIPKDP